MSLRLRTIAVLLLAVSCVSTAEANIIIPVEASGCSPAHDRSRCGVNSSAIIDGQVATFCSGELTCVVNSSGITVNNQTIYCNANTVPNLTNHAIYCVPFNQPVVANVRQALPPTPTAASDGTPIPTAVIRDSLGHLTPCIGTPAILSNNVITCQPTNHP